MILSEVPEVDLAFAISAASVGAVENFEKAKEVIKSIIDTYAMNKLRYGVIVFGSSAAIRVSFGEQFADDEELKTFITLLSGVNEPPALDEALKKGKELFESAKERRNARKILVVIADKKSTSDLEKLKDSAKVLEEGGIIVIPVGIGDESDLTELEATTPDKTNLVNVSSEVVPVDLKNKIMNKVFKGKCSIKESNGHYFVACSVTLDEFSLKGFVSDTAFITEEMFHIFIFQPNLHMILMHSYSTIPFCLLTQMNGTA